MKRPTALCLAALLVACQSSTTPTAADVPPDLRPDAATDDAAEDLGAIPDMSLVEDIPVPDDLPPPATGCQLLADAGAPPPPSDAGLPEPGAYPALHGPGGPTRAFASALVNTTCAHLDGGPTDRDHHNAVLMYDGYLVMPWAHEAGGGGVSVWDFSDACAPVAIATTTDARMRESHTAGFSPVGGRWMVTASLSGVEFWDVADMRAIRMVHEMVLPGVVYPDSYRRVVLSTFWQAPYLYVGAADNGLFIVDATDPIHPTLVTQYVPEPQMSVGGVFVVGNLLVMLSSEGSRTTLLDVSDPAHPRPIPGGSFIIRDAAEGAANRRVQAAYAGHVNGNRVFYARHVLGGGLITYDITDWSAPRFLASYLHPSRANGGYVFLKEDVAFVGLSNLGLAFDVSDRTRLTPTTTFAYTGDLDTISPIGNAVVISVDDDSVDGQASGVVPFRAEPDRSGPIANMVVPRDGAADQSLGTRVGLTFNEFVELGTVWRGSFVVREVGTTAPIEGHYSGQEGLVNFWPARPLRPDTAYEVLIPAGGIRDYAGNPVSTAFRSTFRTVACPGR
ncbi:MAG: hypothetical protein JWM10_1278 [Myxococcaceae bacterium]|nr:hypothetical protein [Myxococcaceae bacterium]